VSTKGKKTSSRVTHKAANELRSPGASKTAKALAGSALSQTGSSKASSSKAASRASGALRDGRTSTTTRALAGSVLAQSESGTKKALKGRAKTQKKASASTGPESAQHVTTRRTADGKSTRVVLAPFRGSSLRRDRVESVVSTVLAKHKKK